MMGLKMELVKLNKGKAIHLSTPCKGVRKDGSEYKAHLIKCGQVCTDMTNSVHTICEYTSTEDITCQKCKTIKEEEIEFQKVVDKVNSDLTTNEVKSKTNKEHWKELKSKHKLNTTEQLLGINEQPRETCPEIDTLTYSIQNLCDLSRSGSEIDTLTEAQSKLKSVYNISFDLEDRAEDIRENAGDIRMWGQQWKDLAKRILEENDNLLEKYIIN